MIKFLHTRLKVNDLESSVAFYQNLGFECRERRAKSPQGNQLAFLYLEGNEHFLELCFNENAQVEVPEDLVHTALGVDDIISYCSDLESKGIEIWPSGWREKFQQGNKKMAFVTDPDGYEVEILEREIT